MTNKHGLSRHIPLPIRREVRQRCGFGCVRCGLGIYDYEHFDPDFADAKTHNANGITLLCPGCNQKRARGWLSRENVAEANKSPKSIGTGMAREMFEFDPGGIELWIGNTLFRDFRTGLMVGGRSIFNVKLPEAPGHPVRFSAVLTDIGGIPLIQIVDNEWRASTDNWDVTAEGGRIEIRNAPRQIALRIMFQPPHRIHLVYACMRYNNKWIQIGSDAKMSITDTQGKNVIEMEHVIIDGFTHPIVITKKGEDPPKGTIFFHHEDPI